MSKVEERLETSCSDFREFVWPKIQGWFTDTPSNSELLATEGSDDRLRECFDHIAGVDFWLIDDGTHMQSIASRVQPTYEYPTFTVRYEIPSGNQTEHHKRIKQYQTDKSLLPTWTVQAYVDHTLQRVQNAAAIPTDQLYRHVISRRCPITEDDLIPAGDERFYAVDWDNLTGRSEIQILDKSRAGVSSKAQSDITEWAGGDD